MELIKTITGKTRVIGVLGNPIAQSMSPVLHNTFAKMLGIDMVYVPFLAEKNALQDAMKGLMALSVEGVNVTIPFKVEVMQYVDEIAEDARLAGAINTIKIQDGRVIGYNTDMYGFEKAFHTAFDMGFQSKKIAVIGAGGTGKVICKKLSMSGVSKIVLLNRTFEKSIEVAQFINLQGVDVVTPISFTDLCVKDILSECDIIINATSVGMVPSINECPLPDDFEFRLDQVAYDVVYKPRSTLFLNKAKSVGARTLNGAGMLFYQGVKAFEIWNDISIDIKIIDEVRGLFLEHLQI